MTQATHYFHKVYFPSRVSKYSLYFNGNPQGDCTAYLVDGERIDRLGRSYPLTDKEWYDANKGPWSSYQSGSYNTKELRT
jgi:hypothetical protein